jgi:hypothetical protein
MTRKSILLTIDETGAQTLKDKHSRFNTIKEEFSTMDQVKEYLTDRYGKVPNGKNKVYQDDENGEAVPVGFTHSFWNKDISHNSKHWHQQDWISVYEKTLTPVKLS